MAEFEDRTHDALDAGEVGMVQPGALFAAQRIRLVGGHEHALHFARLCGSEGKRASKLLGL